MRKSMFSIGSWILIMTLGGVAAGAQDHTRAAKGEVDEETFNKAIEAAQVVVDRQQVMVPAVFRFGPRRGEPMVTGKQSETNTTINVTQSTLETRMGAELFVYGIPVLDNHDDHGTWQLLGRARIVEQGYQDELPLATVQLDEGALLSGAINNYYLLTRDLGDGLVPETPKPKDTMVIAQAVAGRFTVSSRIADTSLDALTRASATSTLREPCRTSVFCSGFPIGQCRCYWSKQEKEYVCGQKKNNVTMRCLGWCPG